MGSRELTSVVAPATPVVSNVKEEKEVNEKRPPWVALICLVLVNIVAWVATHGKNDGMLTC